MKVLRGLALVALLVVAGVAVYLLTHRPAPPAGPNDRITIYYTKPDGSSLVPYTVTRGPASDPHSIAFLAATQAVAGPPPDVDAIRFPSGTFVRDVELNGPTAVVDLNGNVKNTGGGSLTEAGMFKSLVWTLTALHGVSEVQVKVDGMRVATLPDGHLELDEPLQRSSW